MLAFAASYLEIKKNHARSIHKRSLLAIELFFNVNEV